MTKSAVVTQNNGNAINDLGDTIVYTITVTNTGNVNLNNLTVSDTLTDFSGAGLTLTTSPTFISGTNATASTINLGGSAIFRATFTINQQAVDTGGVSNVAFVSAASVVDGSKVASNTSEGFVKLLVGEKYGEVLGAHIVGADATEMIAEYGLAMKLEATAEEIHGTIHAHPTMSEAMMEAAAAVFGEAIHI